VQAPLLDFVLGEDTRPAQQALDAALAPRFGVVADGQPRTTRRVWLDTFDWRLHRAGLTLEQVTGHGPGQLTLTGAGEQLTAAAAGLRWPAPATAVPAGPLRDRLDAVTHGRALLPVVRAVSAITSLRACNADDKTVAWLTVDHTSITRPAAETLPARVSVRAVRGYQAQANRIAERLAATPGMAPASRSQLGTALATAGRSPGDYTGKVEVSLTQEMPARLAAGAVLLTLLDTLEANVGGTLRDLDTEFLHDLRVAVRRTRTALKLCGGVLPGGLAPQFAGEFKWLGDVTTPTRDLDVYLLNYPAMAASLASLRPADLLPFRDYLTRQRVAERRLLARALRGSRFSELTRTWRKSLTGLAPPRRGPAAAELATATIRRAHRRVLALGGAITGESPAESLHDLRKRCKELRYALEFFASLCDPAIHRQAVRELKDLQDCLGTFQDCQVQQEKIFSIAAAMTGPGQAPARALLAMGDLAAQIAVREHRARGEFAGRFAEFASAANRGRFAALTQDAPR
jgi:CHAD domain-containing protein